MNSPNPVKHMPSAAIIWQRLTVPWDGSRGLVCFDPKNRLRETRIGCTAGQIVENIAAFFCRFWMRNQQQTKPVLPGHRLGLHQEIEIINPRLFGWDCRDWIDSNYSTTGFALFVQPCQ